MHDPIVTKLCQNLSDRLNINQQFFIISKPQDKNSLNWPVGSGHSRLGLRIYFFIMKKLSALTTGMEGGLGGGGGGIGVCK